MMKTAALLGVAMAISLLMPGCSSFTAYNAAMGDKPAESLFDTQHDKFACHQNYYDARLCE